MAYCGGIVQQRLNIVLLKPEYPIDGSRDPRWRVVATGDFDDDGKVDIVFQCKNGLEPGGPLRCWWMDGIAAKGFSQVTAANPHEFNVVGPR
jgi:hypothetical protein